MARRIAGTLAAALVSAGTFALGQDTPLLQDERNTIEVFRKASPGVVHVEARAAAETKFEKKVIEAGTATGFFIDAGGRVLTNAHVVDGKKRDRRRPRHGAQGFGPAGGDGPAARPGPAPGGRPCR